MTNKQTQELRDLSVEELEAKHEDLRKDLFTLRNQRQIEKKVEQPHLLREKRRNIARVITVLQEKQAAGAGVEE